MASINKAIIIGNLGSDPEIRVTPNGQSVGTLSIATKEVTTKDGQKEERTEWHRVVVWGKQAENVGKYLKKGSQIFIEGRIQTRSWEDNQGQKKYSTEIIAQQVQFLGGMKSHDEGSSSSSDHNYQSTPSAPSMSRMDDDIPF
jgi:single-strand DNA-binding protein